MLSIIWGLILLGLFIAVALWLFSMFMYLAFAVVAVVITALVGAWGAVKGLFTNDN